MTIHPDHLVALCIPGAFAFIGLVLMAVCWLKGGSR